MTSATDNRTAELREKLTERGVEWTGSRYSGARHAEHTKWTTASGHRAKYPEYHDGQTVLAVDAQNLTPEQAIAATLGNPTCEYVIEDNMNETEGMGDVWFRCTNCDTCYDYLANDWLMKMQHCPKCGATVKGVR